MYENQFRLLSGELFLRHQKIGRNAYYIFENNIILSGNTIRETIVEILCNGLQQWFPEKFKPYFLTKPWYSCKYYATMQNHWVGKTHSIETKTKQSEIKKGRYDGVNNPFYGKHHSDETKLALSKSSKTLVGEKNGFYGKTHSNQTRQILSQKSRAYALANLDKFSQMGLRSVEIQSKGRMTKIERVVNQKLIDMGIKFKYNKIIHSKYQFDFIIGDNILLEVHGDYWHANPNIYGDGKKPLNERQKYKVKRDIEKKEYAEKNGFRIYYIWESDVKNDTFTSLLEIQND